MNHPHYAMRPSQQVSDPYAHQTPATAVPGYENTLMVEGMNDWPQSQREGDLHDSIVEDDPQQSYQSPQPKVKRTVSYEETIRRIISIRSTVVIVSYMIVILWVPIFSVSVVGNVFELAGKDGFFLWHAAHMVFAAFSIGIICRLRPQELYSKMVVSPENDALYPAGALGAVVVCANLVYILIRIFRDLIHCNSSEFCSGNTWYFVIFLVISCAFVILMSVASLGLVWIAVLQRKIYETNAARMYSRGGASYSEHPVAPHSPAHTYQLLAQGYHSSPPPPPYHQHSVNPQTYVVPKHGAIAPSHHRAYNSPQDHTEAPPQNYHFAQTTAKRPDEIEVAPEKIETENK